MGRVLTNTVTLSVANEATQGVLPAQPAWYLQEPNGITQFGATVTTTPRNPINKSRQRRKGTVTDLDSSFEFEADATKSNLEQYLEGFVFARYANPTVIAHIQAGANFQTLAADNDTPVAGTDSGYTHSAITAIPAGTLLFARGFTTTGNNGLKLSIVGSTTTSTLISTALVDETPTEASGASVDVAGFRFTDLTWTDATKTIGSATKNMTTLGLTVGQMVEVGGGTVTEQFPNGRIYGRVKTIATTTIILDKVTNIGSGTLSGGGNQASDTVDLLYGRFARNVSVDHADYISRSVQAEVTYPGLGSGGATRYAYSKGNYHNNLQINHALSDKVTATFGFVGTDTENPTATQKTNAATPILPTQTEAFNTSSNIARLRVTEVDETGLTTCFKDLTVTLNNGVTPEKCLGTLGAVFTNVENFQVDIEATVLFTEENVVSAIRDNRTVTAELILANGDGGFAIDFPSMTLGDGTQNFPVNESVTISLSGQTFQDATLGTSIGVSFWPYLP